MLFLHAVMLLLHALLLHELLLHVLLLHVVLLHVMLLHVMLLLHVVQRLLLVAMLRLGQTRW